MSEVESVLQQLIELFPKLLIVLTMYGALAYFVWVIVWIIKNPDDY